MIVFVLLPQLIPCADPVFQEAADRCRALEAADPGRCVPFGIGSVEAHHRVKVPAIESLNTLAEKLDQIGGRGLLAHSPQVSRSRPADGICGHHPVISALSARVLDGRDHRRLASPERA